MKRAEKNILEALEADGGWMLANRLPDGNGRMGCARGDKLRQLRIDGLIEYGKEPQHSLCGYRITDAGREALAAASR